ncbi:FBD-associated F-box protein At5g22730-like [Vicia villosa]|uniref:FBD-associated F-box protein At5g22730-like n=1 Tax=Vicia villosa TaxID=3911 RepID=UPI00273BD0EA|nr:FBD-associated F-box protein At5g22730-like [Vicia villosa]
MDHEARINNLPDKVLRHILTFLPTKEVIASSVLSKRWIDLWRSVPAFNFYDINVDNQETSFRMNELAYSFLLSANSIQSCKLDIWYNDPDVGYLGFSNVIKWINAVVERGVECIKLCIDISNDYSLKLPISILTCRTLVVLDFFGFALKDFSSISLPSLKTLRMDEIIFLNVQDFLLLLAGCPNLEYLRACYLGFFSQELPTYQVRESLTLHKLIKADLHNTFCHFPLKALLNAKHLILEINEVCRGYDEIPTFHNLTNLKLSSIKCNWNLLFQVLKQCPSLQNVELCQETITEIQHDPGNWVDPIFVPQCLSSQLKTCILWYFSDQKCEYLLATYILKNARVLKTMTIHCREDLQIDGGLYLCPKASPMCEVIIKRQPTLSSIIKRTTELRAA